MYNSNLEELWKKRKYLKIFYLTAISIALLNINSCSKNITKEDRTVFNSYEEKYYNCLGEESARVFIPTKDVLLAVNISMNKCTYKLEEMQEKMKDMGYSSPYVYGYTGAVEKNAKKSMYTILNDKKMKNE